MIYAAIVATDSVNLSPYLDDWPLRFSAVSTLLLSVLSDEFVVEHIGSTAVPGLAAKDCIDVLVLAPSRAAYEAATPLIEQAGFDYRPGAFPDDPPHRFFRRVADGVRTHHIHLLVDGSHEVDAYLALRALLRADAGARQAYETVKRRLIEADPDDRGAYIEGKDALVAALVQTALSRWPKARR